MQRCFGCMREFGKQYEVCPHCGYVVGTAPKIKSHLFCGTVLSGRYMLGKVLGHGGFGITYIAWDKKLNRPVAVKEFFPNALSTRSEGETHVSCYDDKASKFFRDGVRKMLDEGNRLSKFTNNENIVDVYDCFEENNTAYIVMEYLDGKDLKKYLEENGGRLAPEKTVEIIMPVLNALEDMHDEKLIHRDISPDNIFLCKKGGVKLLDFGSARLAVEDSDKSLSVMIKRGYAPKEQYASRSKQGPWTDIYAVCATLYKMITGALPTESIERDEEPLRRFSEFGIRDCNALEKVVFKGLEVDYADRFRSVSELREALNSSIGNVSVPAPADSGKKQEPSKKADIPPVQVKNIIPEAPPKPKKKINIKAIIAAVAAVAVVVGAAFAIKAIKIKVDSENGAGTTTSSPTKVEEQGLLTGMNNEASEEMIAEAYEAYAAYIAPFSGKDKDGNSKISDAYVVDLDKNKIPEVIFTYYGSHNMYILSYGENDGLSVISPVLHSSTPAEVYFSEDNGILYYTDSGHNQGTAWYHEGVCLKATEEGFETVGTVSGDAWDNVSEEIWQDDDLFTKTDKQYDEAFEKSMKELIGDGEYTDFFDVCESENAEEYLEEKLSADFNEKKNEYTQFKQTAVSALGEEPLSILVDDYDRNGTYEAFAVVGEKSEYAENLRVGRVWFISDKAEASAVSEENYYWIDEKLECQYNTYYQIHVDAGSWSPSEVWMVNGSKCEEITVFNENGVEYFEKKSVNGYSNSIVAKASRFDAFLTDVYDIDSGSRHTHKPYFFYDTPDGIKEYGGIEITKAQFEALGGTYYVDLIESSGCTIHSVYARDNGIINVNYYENDGEDSFICDYINLKITSNGVYAISYELWAAATPYTIEERESGTGIYEAAAVPEIATYPENYESGSTSKEAETQPVSNDAWKEAYLNVLRNEAPKSERRTGEYRFSLGYVNNDDIPELFISEGGAHAYGVEVYTYHNGKAVMLCSDGEFGSIGYMERKGYICGSYTGMGTTSARIYEMKNGEAEIIYTLYDDSGAVPEGGDVVRTINDVNASEKEINEFSEKYFGDNTTYFGYESETNPGYEPTEENYKKYITDFEG
ncbi:MAG: serine/threonine protein kinase [Clostridia bacterium]|nr:serine/threonine protein kinase [Clostridia bacterium]